MTIERDKLYQLLPAVYRRRDADLGYPLRALLSVLTEQVQIVEDDLDQRYEDLFIETCAEWVVPYIGDLLGVRNLNSLKGALQGRAEVANTIAYRRRKGTATMLEQLARDMTGWAARVVEFFELLATTQYMNHIRPGNGGTLDLRNWEALENVGTAFEQTAHTMDARNIPSGGRFNIPNVGIFLWRLGAYPISQSQAFRVDAHRFMFSPLGNNLQLHTRPTAETSITQQATRLNVPVAISRRMLHEYLDDYWGQDLSLVIWRDGVAVPIEQIEVCNLADTTGGGWAHEPDPGRIGIDPVLGRIAFADAPTEEISVSFNSAFSAAMGGGEYARDPVSDDRTASLVPADHATIAGAVADNAGGGRIQIENSRTYTESVSLTLADDANLVIDAETGARPHLQLSDDMVIEGGGATVAIAGLLISGAGIRIRDGVRQVLIRHCTLVPGLTLERDGIATSPGAPSVVIESPETRVIIEHSIVGAIHAHEDALVSVADSIVDAGDKDMTAFAGETGSGIGAPLTLDRCTVVGQVSTRILSHASNCIFWSDSDVVGGVLAVEAERLQEGCIRFSYVDPDARVPRRYRCQPSSESPSVRPFFTSLRYGDPGYAQLHEACSVEIRTGADDEAEMGVFHDLYQPQRITNLHIRLDEYLRFGLDSGEIFES